MKKFTLTSLWLFALVMQMAAQVNFTANNQVTPYTGRFRAGVNLGYYPLWGNQQMANVAAGNPAVGQAGVGARAVRQGFPDLVLGNPIYGYNFLRQDFDHYNSLNMSNGEAVAIVGDPLPWHQDLTNYCPSDPTKQSRLFGNLYTPTWDGGLNGTPYNDNNYWAAYLYEVVTRYKDDVRFWEIWNEPGLDFGACGWRPPGDPQCEWWTRDPSPCELYLGAPIEHYIRTLRIAYDIIKTVDPDSYVCLGSMGYQAGLDAILRNTDNPNGGTVSAEHPLFGGAYFDCVTMHNYPHFDGSTLNFDGGIFQRHSDRAADGMFLFRDTYQGILNNYGYNGTTFPRKEFISTEVNAPRHSYPAGQYFAGEVQQRNYIQKVYIVSKLERIGSMHVYQLFDRKLPQNANYEFDEMGMYKTIEPTGPNTVGPYGQQLNDEGIAFKTVSDLVFPTDYDATETARMGLTTNGPVRGYAFRRANGQFVYALWARTFTDLSETANATYSFPGAMGLTSLVRHDWNWSSTQSTTTVSPSGIQLTATPQFFVGGSGTPTCVLTTNVTNLVCNNAGTASNPADDTYTFTVTINSSGPCGTGWTQSGAATGTGTYGTARNYGPFLISSGGRTLTYTDNSNATFNTTINISPPATCSSPCTITGVTATTDCNNNGTPAVTTDDTYTITLNASGTGSCGTGYSVSGTGIATTGVYGTNRVIGPFPISSGNRVLTLTDNVNPGSTATATAIAPAPCSNPGNTCSNNLLTNPGFESGPGGGWNLGSGVTIVTGGNGGSANAVSHCTNGQRIWQTVSSSTTGSFTFSAVIRHNGTAASGTLALKFMNSSFTPLAQQFTPVIAAATYAPFSVTATAPAGTAFIEISVIKESGAGCLIIDDLCVGQSGTAGPTVTFTSCPVNITVNATGGATSAVANYATPTATATNCATAVSVVRTSPANTASGSSFPLGTTNVLWTGTCGTATATCAFTVTVVAAGNPTVTFTACPANITVTAAAGATSAVASYSTPVAIATNCTTTPTVVRTSPANTASGSSFPIGTTNVLWTGTCGTASATCAFTVTVVAANNPTVTFTTCPANITVNAAAGATSAVATYATPTATATNCATAVSVVRTSPANTASGSSFPVGTTNVLWTGTCGTASATCAFTVTVQAGTPVTCTNNLLANGSLEAVPFQNWNAGGSSTTTQVPGGANGTATAGSICTDGNRIYQTLNAVAGRTYSLTLSAKQANGIASGTTVIKFLNSSWTPLLSDFGGINSTTTDYKIFTVDEIAPAGTAFVEISVLKQSGVGCLVFDEICLTDGNVTTPCTITAAASSIVCSNNGTPANAADDTYTFNLTVTNTGACGTGWGATGGITGPYGAVRAFGPFPISAGNRTIVVNDLTVAGATTTVVVPAPATCSTGGGCTLSTAVSNIVCDNNGTPTNPADDRFTFDLLVNPVGVCGTGTTWFASGGFTTASIPYGTPRTSFSQPISGGPFTFTVFSNTGGASQVVTVAPPATCSGGGGNAPDLALTLASSSGNPAQWSPVTFTLTITNNGTVTANGVFVQFLNQSSTAVSDRLSYVSHTAAAGTTLNAWIGDWNIGTLAPGQSRVLTYVGFNKIAGANPIFGQVRAQTPADLDSAPNNNTTGVPVEDDEARVILNGGQALQSNDPSQMTEQELAAAFVLFPNPASESVSIMMEPYLRKEVHIRVVNQLGRQVDMLHIDDLRTPTAELQLADYQNGIYFVQISSPGQRDMIRKLIVTRMY